MYLQNSSIIIQEPNIENFKDLEAIIIAAPLYEEEIIRSLREKGYKGDIITTEKKYFTSKIIFITKAKLFFFGLNFWNTSCLIYHQQ